jgi:rod shape-determining protein MreC
MRRINYRPFLYLAFLLFFILCLPLQFTEGLRSKFIGPLTFSWAGLSRSPKLASFEIEQLKLENHSLRAQIQSIREWLLFEERIEEQVKRFQALTALQSAENLVDADHAEAIKAFFKRRSSYLGQFLEKQFLSIPARVIFREPASWSSLIWLNVGERDNEALKRKVIEKNSPILVGTSVVGVIEYVGYSHSRARLITDASLTPAVRASRGAEQNRLLFEPLESLLLSYEVREDLPKREEVIALLREIKGHLRESSLSRYLAKGELHGDSQPLWRARGAYLKGIGFNYDFADEEGTARDLRSSDSILKVGDVLVTSGLDGIFPPDLPIALVTKIGQLREGATSYELEAKALCGSLEELSQVFVLPAFDSASKISPFKMRGSFSAPKA